MSRLPMKRYISQACCERMHSACPRSRGMAAADMCDCKCHSRGRQTWVPSGVKYPVDVDAARERAFAEPDSCLKD